MNFKLIYSFAFWISLIGLFAIISDFGFSQSEVSQKLLDRFYFFILGIGLITTAIRYFLKYYNFWFSPVIIGQFTLN